MMLRRGFQVLRLGYCSNVKMQVSTFASWYSAVAMVSLTSLLSDDLSSVIFGQSTIHCHSGSIAMNYTIFGAKC